MVDGSDISRRSFLSGRLIGQVLGSAANALNDAERRATEHATETGRHGVFPLLRPPHAVAEPLFLSGCTRCRACLEACPHGAIVPAPARFRAAAGTPMIDPITQPCLLCEDTPCVTACEPKVLRSDLPLRMGTARINVVTCLAHLGSFCSVCAEHCPVEGAIEVRGGRPTIDARACIGCGVCQHVCPAPENAVLLTPEAARPGAQAPPQPAKPLAPWELDLQLVSNPFAGRQTTTDAERPDPGRMLPRQRDRGSDREG